MTRYAPLWQQGGTYPAQTDRGLLSTLWPSSGSTGGAVTTVANTMQVSVAPGTAAVALASATGSALCRWDAAEVVTLTAAPVSGSSRIDLIVLQVRDNALDSGGNNDFIFQAIAGTVATPGPGPVPTVPNNAYAMCQLTVPGGAANLNGVTVVDLRAGLPALVANRRFRVTQATSIANLGSMTPMTFTGGTVDYNTVGADINLATGRFTPTVAGYYLITSAIGVNHPNVAGNQLILGEIWKNGASWMRGTQLAVPATYAVTMMATMVAEAYLNGAGDYLDIRAQDTAGAASSTAPGLTWFAASLRA